MPDRPPRIALPSGADLNGSHDKPSLALLLNARRTERRAIKALADGSRST